MNIIVFNQIYYLLSQKCQDQQQHSILYSCPSTNQIIALIKANN